VDFSEKSAELNYFSFDAVLIKIITVKRIMRKKHQFHR